MDALKLSQADTRRLEKLARACGRTPRAVLKYVLRDGFAATENAVKAITERAKSEERISHEEAMRQFDSMILAHTPQKAA